MTNTQNIFGLVFGCVVLSPLLLLFAEELKLPTGSVCGNLQFVSASLPDCSNPNAIPSTLTDVDGVENCCKPNKLADGEMISECCPKVAGNVMCDTGYSVDACKCRVMCAADGDDCNDEYYYGRPGEGDPKVELCCYDYKGFDAIHVKAIYLCCEKVGTGTTTKKCGGLANYGTDNIECDEGEIRNFTGKYFKN